MLLRLYLRSVSPLHIYTVNDQCGVMSDACWVPRTNEQSKDDRDDLAIDDRVPRSLRKRSNDNRALKCECTEKSVVLKACDDHNGVDRTLRA